MAGWFAIRTKQSELRSQRLLELERQGAATRAEVFQPLVEGIGDMWDQISKGTMTPEWYEMNLQPQLKKFMVWAPVYGADDTVWTFHRCVQSIHGGAPNLVTMRLLVELVLALRRELAHPASKVTALDVMGFRVSDIYEGGVAVPWVSLPERELYAHEGWTPPWGDRFKEGKPLQTH